MLQGTSSNAGKSILVAAFCRILLQDGLRVAPFKAQNMSNNSFVTRHGEEVARAQVVQAQACRLDPDVRFSPILLKPASDVGCQVIVGGKPVGNMVVHEYDAFKPQAFATVKASYDSLAAEFDAVVIEGAGSPGEVNLKHTDIVNMRMAQYADAPVLLVGDIDRGGVYASFVGTLEVLEEWERRHINGFIVNKFRGDQSLLDAAHEYVLRHTGKPVLGVVPWLPRLDLPDEDAVSFKESAVAGAPAAAAGQIELAVLDLPHIANFTDFDPFRVEPDVTLRVVHPGASELGTPDAVIIPGTKNTLGDLERLQAYGLGDRLKALAARGVEIVGVCAGFQMLGEVIADPHGLEAPGLGQISGLGLLPVTTTLAAEKTLRRVTAVHRPSGLAVTGYEIHHGQTSGPGAEVILAVEGEIGGAASPTGRVWGTYLHGIFDSDDFRRWFIDRLRQRRGLAPLGRAGGATFDLEPAFDRLAAAVRAGVDLRAIYRFMGL